MRGAQVRACAPPTKGLTVPFYAIPDHLSFCEIDARTIFLDLRRDRYIELDPETRATLNRCRAADAPSVRVSADVEHLQRLGLIVESTKPTNLAAIAIDVPQLSLRDEPSPRSLKAWPIVPEVLALLLHNRRILKRGGIEVAVSEVRSRNADRSRPRSLDGELLEAAQRFRAARLLIPIQPNCLLDSLSLSSFLSRRGLRASLIFGVKLDPFAAHCWLQTAGAIVNDGADTVTAFTPVLSA
jgi:hypothetical protein